MNNKVKNPCKKCGKELKIGGGSPDFIGGGQTFYYYCECGFKGKDKGKKHEQ